MKPFTILFAVVVATNAICAWSLAQTNEIRKAEWLIGTWEYKTAGGSLFETWKKTSDSELAGKTYMIKNTDTVILEKVRLVQEPAGLFYIPCVEGQNNNLPVRFLAGSISETQLIFGNPQHDFPQVISYKKISNDSLIAEISGTKDGRERKQSFPMRRLR